MTRAIKVLIAEDSFLQAERLKDMLNTLGLIDVSIAMNGMSAIEYFEQALLSEIPFSLVFIDIIMPELDGQEALRRIRVMEKSRGVPDSDKSIIIMTTALNSPRDMMDALLDGDCTDYIVKPVEESNLRAMLARYKCVD